MLALGLASVLYVSPHHPPISLHRRPLRSQWATGASVMLAGETDKPDNLDMSALADRIHAVQQSPPP